MAESCSRCECLGKSSLIPSDYEDDLTDVIIIFNALTDIIHTIITIVKTL